MGIQDLLESIRESFTSTANARMVFGDPVQANGRTVIPAAKIAYGFGGGGGSGTRKETLGGEGGGGGGGIRAKPAGAIEISDGQARWIPASNWLMIAVALDATFVAGLLLGLIAGRRRR